MAEHHVLLIEHPARLKIDAGRLRIERDEHPSAFVLPEDIDVLCLHHPAISISNGALQALAEAGAVVLLTDERHQPSAQLYPLKSHARQSLRLRNQIWLDAGDRPAHLWREIVQARIRSEAATLRKLNCNGALFLERLSLKVEPGDAAHHEGQAARHYWKHLFGNRFRRNKQGANDGINSRLNFGYAVLRSMIARQLAIMGLNLSLGLGHRSSENPFNLVDDFIEPYRYLVERHVAMMDKDILHQPLQTEGKRELLGFIHQTVPMNDGEYRLNGAIEATIHSYCRVLDKHTSSLTLPVF
jgi:CRISPR-associated protein Cas1